MKNTDLLYEKQFEHDACGVGFVADIEGKRTNRVLTKAIEGVINLTHRGAIGGDQKTGDGAGILTQLPLELFNDLLQDEGVKNIKLGNLGVGMFFLPNKAAVNHSETIQIIENTILEDGVKLLLTRSVPVNTTVLGEKALDTLPEIYQFFVSPKSSLNQDKFERQLFKIRKKIEAKAIKNKIEDLYCCSFSSKTICYKGMLVPRQLDQFYLDLRNPNYKTNLAVFHSRYSTNTFPDWKLAHPYRAIGHNGEINTLMGNKSWIRARENSAISKIWKENINDIKPFVAADGSDSADLDNALELLTLSGRSILESVCMLIPEAYEKDPDINEDLRAFYDYSSCIVEPWDGPAAVVFTDGRYVGAALDRNGLRPIRYNITDDNLIVLGSEIGIVDIPPKNIIRSGRVAPGKILAVDTKEKILMFDNEIKENLSKSTNYKDWASESFHKASEMLSANELNKNVEIDLNEDDLLNLQKAFGYTLEDMERLIEPMSINGKEPMGSMGDDTPISALSSKPKSVFTYFKQRFAQVTNPPIDPYREESVMSLRVLIGDKSNFLDSLNRKQEFFYFDSPIITNEEINWIKKLKPKKFKVSTIETLFAANKENNLKTSLKKIVTKSINEVDNGAKILLLSDKNISQNKAPIPIMLAVSAIHHELISQGKRMKVSIVVESGEVREDHQVCCLLGYGASCINPYLAFASVKDWMKKFDDKIEVYLSNYKLALERGVLKVMSKMGISTVASYTGSQIFEIVGIDTQTTDTYFPGTVSRIEGVSIDNFEADTLALHSNAFNVEKKHKLGEEGIYRFRKGGEYHYFNPLIFKSIRKLSKTGSYDDYKKFVSLHEDRPPSMIRDLFEFDSLGEIPIEQVEDVEEIFKRFRTGAMSHGALSTEAHEAVAIAVNKIGGKSNSGEGGENSKRFTKDADGSWRNSAIKQVASGRFGVTPEYLASAEMIEIKMAQGAKPGEGGQIPGPKVSSEIASQRFSVPGVGLISPPPHHDIYSIEDLAQLIYDLKHANTTARISVKLVSEVGVGTVAAGVAKGYADNIQISGSEGGTGASPLGSIKNAGIPGEMGLAETQQVLVMNDLRGRVSLTVDGGVQRGFDVVVAAILGADAYGFGTSVLVSLGCVMARQCHLNTCPVGIASQKPELREKFPGIPDEVVNYFYAIGNDIREILSKIGVKSINDIIGRTELLKIKSNIPFNKTSNIDLSKLIGDPDPSNKKPRRQVFKRNDRSENPIDFEILKDVASSIENGERNSLELPIRNTDRTVGAILSSEIVKKYGNKGLPNDTVTINLRGIAGQSFGGYLVNGVSLFLEGEANDYVGKSMHGGKVIIFPDRDTNYLAEGNSIIGNTVLYGATGGYFYAAGCAGERFCVRNSGVVAIVEGVGDHACEYMTGGEVYIIGPIGKNLGAGMSGGLAYILDENKDINHQVNHEMVSIEKITRKDIEKIKFKLNEHYKLTKSNKAKKILDNFQVYEPRFLKIVPKEISKLLKSKGINIDDFDFVNPKLD